LDGRCEEAIPEYETVIALNRNAVPAYRNLGNCKLFTGLIEETISLEQKAILISPRDPLIGFMYWRIGTAHLLRSHVDEAIVWFEKARNADPVAVLPHSYLTSAYALNGETERAASELAEARRLSADGRYSSLAQLKAIFPYWGTAKVHALFEATYFAELRKAGMPEE
jgi:tetratricopeptide (TPR) repeat protein